MSSPKGHPKSWKCWSSKGYSIKISSALTIVVWWRWDPHRCNYYGHGPWSRHRQWAENIQPQVATSLPTQDIPIEHLPIPVLIVLSTTAIFLLAFCALSEFTELEIFISWRTFQIITFLSFWKKCGRLIFLYLMSKSLSSWRSFGLLAPKNLF